MTTLYLATTNPGKIREFNRILEALPGDLRAALPPGGMPDVEETGTTFAENSLIKARHAAEATGLPAIADDSGLSVDALDGAPGVYSARYAGGAGDEANNDKLLAELEGVVPDKRPSHWPEYFTREGIERMLRAP